MRLGGEGLEIVEWRGRLVGKGSEREMREKKWRVWVVEGIKRGLRRRDDYRIERGNRIRVYYRELNNWA